MNLTNNTVLITGGSSGIGLELSKRLIALNNKVIICGRSEEKLKAAKALIPELVTYPCDLSNKQQCHDLSAWLKQNHKDLNVLINNAALVHNTNFMEANDSTAMAELEINTNLLAPIILIKELVPILVKNANPTLINVTTGLIYTPRASYPFYNATKAALHSFTQILRAQLGQTDLEIIEVMFPAVDTPWHKNNPPKVAIPVDQAVEEMIKGLSKGILEIRIAKVKLLYFLSRVAPNFAFKKLNNLQ